MFIMISSGFKSVRSILRNYLKVKKNKKIKNKAQKLSRKNKKIKIKSLFNNLKNLNRKLVKS